MLLLGPHFAMFRYRVRLPGLANRRLNITVVIIVIINSILRRRHVIFCLFGCVGARCATTVIPAIAVRFDPRKMRLWIRFRRRRRRLVSFLFVAPRMVLICSSMLIINRRECCAIRYSC